MIVTIRSRDENVTSIFKCCDCDQLHKLFKFCQDCSRFTCQGCAPDHDKKHGKNKRIGLRPFSEPEKYLWFEHFEILCRFCRTINHRLEEQCPEEFVPCLVDRTHSHPYNELEKHFELCASHKIKCPQCHERVAMHLGSQYPLVKVTHQCIDHLRKVKASAKKKNKILKKHLVIM